MPTVNWGQFRDGDRVRVTIEGTWHQRVTESDDRPPFAHLELAPGSILTEGGSLAYVASAELIERPFTPPAAGTLFRAGSGALHMSDGDCYRSIRTPNGMPIVDGVRWLWAEETSMFIDSIEVLDV